MNFTTETASKGVARFSWVLVTFACSLWLLLPPKACGQQEHTPEDAAKYKVNEHDWTIELTTKNGFVHGFAVVPVMLGRLFDAKQADQLALVDSQRESFEKLAKDAMQQAVRRVEDWVSNNDEDESSLADLEEAIASISEECGKRIRDEILLPHQLNLLDRYPIYLMTLRNGVFRMLAYGPLGDSVELSDEQRRQLEEKADKMRQKIIQTVIELEDELHRELTSVLDPKQRKVVDAMRTDFVRRQNYNLNNLIQQLDRSTIGSCAGCDASKVVLPIPEANDAEMRSVLEK